MNNTDAKIQSVDNSHVNATAATCLIVGAGLAGLIAADELRRSGVSLLVLDKGRGVGGRLATRRVGEGVFDHGAQFFTVRQARFQGLVDEWLAAGVAHEWCLGFADRHGVTQTDGHLRYCGIRGMNGIAKHLARNLDVHTSDQIVRIDRNDEHGKSIWTLSTQSGKTYTAIHLLLTPPVPQSLALIESGDYRLPLDAREKLMTSEYDPCLALMLDFREKIDMPVPGAIQIEGGEPVYWIADNSRKGIAPGERTALTIHAGAAWSRCNYDDADAVITEKLLVEVAVLLNRTSEELRSIVNKIEVKRWRYSKPTRIFDERCVAIEDVSLYFAGDAFGEPRVEGAALSGLAAADEIKARL